MFLIVQDTSDHTLNRKTFIALNIDRGALGSGSNQHEKYDESD
ncbi:hypothetical protein [Lentilactobacillus sunkii]|jgi:hypothetical protein|nr:hypothetical protein [Lentilactobacillus sunkii]